ncbi:MAG: PorV/PorQ family protein [Elusimicrobia bacterium]|nr:PorV/PorQ family protein [Elusimicrobiota bacterium]
MTRALLLPVLLLAPVAARAAAAAGAATLRQPVSARAVALGEACAAVAGGAETLGSNPAGAARAARPGLTTAFTSGAADDSFGFVGWAAPTRRGALLAGAAYYDAGSVALNFAGGGAQTVAAERDGVILAGWALPLDWGLSAGALAKAYRFELAERAVAAGWAADAGLQWTAPAAGLSLGAAVQNLGPDAKFEVEGDPLPLTARGGAAWTLAGSPDNPRLSYYSAARLMLTADAVKVRDERPHAAAGAEFSLDFGPASSAAVRLGWTFNRDSSDASFGLGLREGRWSLDYALARRGELGGAHHVSLGMSF